MKRLTDRESFMKSITVQPNETEEFALVPVRLLQSLREEIDDLRTQLGLPERQWEQASADTVDQVHGE